MISEHRLRRIITISRYGPESNSILKNMMVTPLIYLLKYNINEKLMHIAILEVILGQNNQKLRVLSQNRRNRPVFESKRVKMSQKLSKITYKFQKMTQKISFLEKTCFCLQIWIIFDHFCLEKYQNRMSFKNYFS